MIEVKNLSLSRDGKKVLDDINVTIPKGGLVAIIGPNGAGKSTFLHCLAGLLRPDCGTIRIGGQDLHTMKDHMRARVLSLLTQSQGSVPRLTVRDLISFGRWPHHQGRPSQHDKTVVEAAIERFDLGDLAGRHVEALSGGQKQRAYIAMSYAQETPWMLLDEPLAALDPKFTRDIMARLQGLEDRTTLISLHDLNIAANATDWVIGLKKGGLHHNAPWSEGGTAERLADLFDVDFRMTKSAEDHVVLW